LPGFRNLALAHQAMVNRTCDFRVTVFGGASLILLPLVAATFPHWVGHTAEIRRIALAALAHIFSN
jgi:hypothetical protein